MFFMLFYGTDHAIHDSILVFNSLCERNIY